MKLLSTLFIPFFINATFVSAQKTIIDSLAKKAGIESSAKNYLSAIKIYTQITEKEPTDSKYWFYRGQAYMMVNDFKHAEPDYNKALQLNSKYFDAYLSRAILYFNLNDAEKSINDYNQALRYCSNESMNVFIKTDN